MPYREQIRQNERNLFNLAKLILICMAVQLVVICYVFYQSYSGRQDVVSAQRAGCERGKLDRGANADGWRIAEAARRNEGQEVVARQYAKIATELEERSQIDCTQAFPKAGLIP